MMKDIQTVCESDKFAKELTQMILPSEHLFAVCALKGRLTRVLANVIDWNLIQKKNKPHLSELAENSN